MPIPSKEKNEIKKRIINILNIEEKSERLTKEYYEGDRSPFLTELFSDKNLIVHKILISLSTTMGMSFYEQVCKLLSEYYGNQCITQEKIQGIKSASVSKYLTTLEVKGYVPDRDNELNQIKSLCQKEIKETKGKNIEYDDDTVDVYIVNPKGEETLIDITTVKPNKKEFITLVKKLRVWSAQRLSQDTNAKINAYIGIPYNPFSKGDIEGIKYDKWSNYYDRKDILVGTELWNKVSNNNVTVSDLSEIFASIGETMKKKIEQQISSIK
tara:strand:+ start:1608 stop:2414 length:807 start_codon:yes stop_codon:yes gene_type:complete